jgi:two-component sensor histidine kinase
VLTLNAAVKLCMVLHELASNATKHGALKAEHGRIDIRWMLSADGASLSVSWQEQDGAVREGASEKGFGSALITTLVEKDLNGTMEAAWARTAFACASNCRRTRCSPCRPQQVWPCLKRNTRPAAKPA